MREHNRLHELTETAGGVFRDAVMSIFGGHEHHDPWEPALERWEREHPSEEHPRE